MVNHVLEGLCVVVFLSGENAIHKTVVCAILFRNGISNAADELDEFCEFRLFIL